MQSLPHDLMPIIFGYIRKITDKRQFTQTCKIYNLLTRELIKNIDIKFMPKHNYSPYFEYKCYTYPYIKNNNYCMENFTIELCHDSYFDLIPQKYINQNNTIIAKAAIMYNNIDLLKMVINNVCYITHDTRNMAIGYGRLEMVKLLIHNDCNWCPIFSDTAAIGGHLNILNWAKENHFQLNTSNISYQAVKFGHLNIIKWCVSNDIKLHIDSCPNAAKHGHLEMLKFLLEYGCSLADSYLIAEKYKHKHITDWLRYEEYFFSS